MEHRTHTELCLLSWSVKFKSLQTCHCKVALHCTPSVCLFLLSCQEKKS